MKTFVYAMYRDRIRDNTLTYPECWDTRCRDNDCWLYLKNPTVSVKILNCVIYSSKMVIQYSLPRISLISSYIITNKALILSIFWKQRSSYFPAKKIPHKVRKTEINTAIVSHTCKFECHILITTETFLINNIWENISELVNITEV